MRLKFGLLRYSSCQSIGEIQETNPRFEEVFGFGRFYLVHSIKFKADGYASGPTSKHTWRLQSTKAYWKFIFQYGVAR